jgi:MFS family permease
VEGSFGEAFASSEFRALWAAEALSQVGDQLARVALTGLVFERTGSAALSALTLGLSYTPSLAGSALLSGLADRFPRRDVMIGCDLASVVLVVLMAIPGMPLAVVCAVMAGVALIGGPFRAARLALLPELLSGDAYVAALAARTMTIQTAQLLGFAAGGAVVGLISPYVALLADAVTFGVSAVLLFVLVSPRPAPQRPAARRRFWSSSIHGARVIAGIPGLPALYALGMLAGCYIGPEGLAAVWVSELAAPTWTVGLVMAAPPLGLVLGSWLITRYIDAPARHRWTGPLAIAAGAVLAPCAFRPALWLVLVLLVVSGMCTAYQIQVGASFGTAAPAGSRAQVMGLLNSGALTVQGLGILLSGIVAEHLGAARAVALAGALGALLAIPPALAHRRADAAPPVTTR